MIKMKQLYLQNARQIIEDAVLFYRDEPVGTLASIDTRLDDLNYKQVFTRDFFVCALFYLFDGKYRIVKNFLQTLVDLQSIEKQMDCFDAGKGLMPASFHKEIQDGREILVADFGARGIGRVTPVDSCLWWLYLLRIYTRVTGDTGLARKDDFQQAIRLITDLYLTGHFELIPALLVPDGSFMIDRRMGVYGHPIDVEALFYAALRSVEELVEDEECVKTVRHRIEHLQFHVRSHYWIDRDRLRVMRGHTTEGLGEKTVNKYNIQPASIPEWAESFLGDGGYFLGNLGSGRVDFRFFTSGNLLAVLSGLADEAQGAAIMSLLEKRQDLLVGEMPLKLCYPALEGEAWHLLTGADSKNKPWSYHNGGNWPFLSWLWVAAAIKTGNEKAVERVLDKALDKIAADSWPEYYEGKRGERAGRQARSFQIWSCSGMLVAEQLLRQPQLSEALFFEKDFDELLCPFNRVV